MAKISKQFADAFFNADDFEEGPRTFAIDFVEEEDVGKDTKLVVHFVDEDKTWPLNKTNALRLAEWFGDETDDWTGAMVTLYQSTTMFNGKRTDCVRVKKASQETGSGGDSGSPGASDSRPVRSAGGKQVKKVKGFTEEDVIE